MSRFSEALRRIRFERHMTQEEFAALLGTTKQNISRYEQGTVSPKISTAQAIADKLGITLAELNGGDRPSEAERHFPSNVPAHDQTHVQRVPKIGAVAAGEPIMAPEEYGVFVNSPVKCDAAVDVRGDSMIPSYLNGDVVYIREQPDVLDGHVAVVFLDDEAVIKRVYHEPNGLALESDNPAYDTIHATVDDYPNLRVFGIPVGFTRMYRSDPLNMIHKGFKK